MGVNGIMGIFKLFSKALLKALLRSVTYGSRSIIGGSLRRLWLSVVFHLLLLRPFWLLDFIFY